MQEENLDRILSGEQGNAKAMNPIYDLNQPSHVDLPRLLRTVFDRPTGRSDECRFFLLLS